MITGDTRARCWFVHYGIGKNGKSVLMTTLMKNILGPYYLTCDKSILIKTNISSGLSPEKMALYGKRLAAYSEGETADHMELNLSNIKQITGQDPISARGLYKDPIEFHAISKLNMLSNYIIGTSGNIADVDRFRYIFYDARFAMQPKEGERQEDKDFISKLETIYLDEVFSWIAKGCKSYYEDRIIEMPQAFKERSMKFTQGVDSISSFLTHRVEFTKSSQDYIKKAYLFELYKSYCNLNSLQCKPRSTLYNEFINLKHEPCMLHGIEIYRNIKVIKNSEEVDSDEDC
jgi:putative DNA primase/helicase